MRIAVLSPGEMGSAVGSALVAVGHEVGWLPAGRSVATRERAERGGLVAWANLRDCDLVISICPPAVALETARAAGGFAGTYLDANAVSPTTAAEVARVVGLGGATYVDGGIVGPPPRVAGTTRLFLSGPDAGAVAGVFAGSTVQSVVVEAGPFAASAVKMTYAAWTKISAALLLSAHETAVALGVDQALDDEWARSQPDLSDRLAVARDSAARKGWRWEDEMRQIAETFAAADQPEGFGVAAAAVFAGFPRVDPDGGERGDGE